MSEPLRAVADVNVLVSAIRTPAGLCGRLIDEALTGRWLPVISDQLIEELEDVLARPAFRNLLSDEVIARFVLGLRAVAELVDDPPPAQEQLTRDPDDDYLIALAREARADGLISGDRDLLDLVDPEPPIWTPSIFMAMILGGSSE